MFDISINYNKIYHNRKCNDIKRKYLFNCKILLKLFYDCKIPNIVIRDL